MYHATLPKNVSAILEQGFKNSQGSGNLLGSGIYVSRDITKTEQYGPVCFKLLVYPGKTYGVCQRNDPMRTSWHGEHSSAWVPPNTTFWHSEKEETCVKSTRQVRILGIARGWDRLPQEVRRGLRNLQGTGDTLDKMENRVLDDMLERLGIVYCHLVNTDTQMMMEADSRGGLRVGEWSGSDNQQWTRTWDNCMENKADGRVLGVNGDQLAMEEVEAAGDKAQKWKLDNRGRLLHKVSNRVVSVVEDRVELKRFTGGSSDNWIFRCMENTRQRDDFVEHTPWHDMLSWPDSD